MGLPHKKKKRKKQKRKRRILPSTQQTKKKPLPFLFILLINLQEKNTERERKEEFRKPGTNTMSLGYAEKLSYIEDVGNVGMPEIFDSPKVFQEKVGLFF